MSLKDVNIEIIKNENYRFLMENPILGKNIILMTYGGSHAYGTNIPTSDIDIRGIVFSPTHSLLGNDKFEQYEDKETDTVIYGLNKMIELLLNCNPNCIEILGARPEDYFIISEEGKKLIDNRKIFLSKKAIKSFGGYANSQLRRLQNALARDSYSQEDKERHILGSVKHAMDDILRRYHTINDKIIEYNITDFSKTRHAFKEYNKKMEIMEEYRSFDCGNIYLYPDISDRQDMNVEIFCDVHLTHYPLRDYKNIWNEMNSIVKDYDKLGKRNSKKDDLHLNKHAMHLIRLYYMCIDILEKEEIVTYRKDEHDLLMDIRNGYYQKSDGTYRSEFFELVDELEKRMNYAAQNTNLPDLPDTKTAYEMLYEMNKKHIIREM